MRRRLIGFCAVLSAVVAANAVVHAGTLNGKVRDVTKPRNAKDSGIAGVTVIITPQDKPPLGAISTGADGTFVMPEVPPGSGKVTYSSAAYDANPTFSDYQMPVAGDSNASDCLLWPHEVPSGVDTDVVAENLVSHAQQTKTSLADEWSRIGPIRISPTTKVDLARALKSKAPAALISENWKDFCDADPAATRQAQELLNRAVTEPDKVPSQSDVEQLKVPRSVIADAVVWAYTSQSASGPARDNFASNIRDHWDSKLLAQVGKRAELSPEAQRLITIVDLKTKNTLGC